MFISFVVNVITNRQQTNAPQNINFLVEVINLPNLAGVSDSLRFQTINSRSMKTSDVKNVHYALLHIKHMKIFKIYYTIKKKRNLYIQ